MVCSGVRSLSSTSGADSLSFSAVKTHSTSSPCFWRVAARELDHSMNETALGLAVVASRWLDDDWWPNVVDGFFHIAPALIRPLAANAARRRTRMGP